MSLGSLIESLKNCPKGAIFKEGFRNPHSYRGDYHDLAVEPAQNVSVEEMIESLQNVVGTELRGYKGGWFLMTKDVDVYLSYYGCNSDNEVLGWGAKSGEGFCLITSDSTIYTI